MARHLSSKVAERRRKPATSPEAREQEIAALAYDLAEEQIQNGTVSAQVQTHFLKVGSRREQLEQQRIEHENELTKVKIQAIEDQAKIEELYIGAIEAMKSYGGGLRPQLEPGDGET